jgi:hypothetical protein
MIVLGLVQLLLYRHELLSVNPTHFEEVTLSGMIDVGKQNNRLAAECLEGLSWTEED